MSAPDTTETEALGEAWGQHRIWTQEDGQFSNCSCGGWGWNGDVSSAIPQFVTHRSQAVADSLASDWLATRDAAQRAEAWRDGYQTCAQHYGALVDDETVDKHSPYRIGGAS